MGTHFTYDEGLLEITVVGMAHEHFNRTLATLVEIVAEETDRDFHHAGSTTFKRKDLGKGFEPDSCFYIGHAGQVRKAELDPISGPPPTCDRRRYYALLSEPVPDIHRDGRSGSMAFRR